MASVHAHPNLSFAITTKYVCLAVTAGKGKWNRGCNKEYMMLIWKGKGGKSW